MADKLNQITIGQFLREYINKKDFFFPLFLCLSQAVLAKITSSRLVGAWIFDEGKGESSDSQFPELDLHLVNPNSTCLNSIFIGSQATTDRAMIEANRYVVRFGPFSCCFPPHH